MFIPPELEEPEELRRRVRLLVADRRSPEAAALFGVLMRYAHRRVIAVSRKCGDALVDSEQEEVVADVLMQLMSGSLAAFRGNSIPELLGYVRTIADRTTWRVIRRKEREARTLEGEDGADAVERWSAVLAAPDATAERIVDSPLPEADQGYLVDLLKAGSKAEFARRSGVSRAAVTQRVQRISQRIAELAPGSRAAHDVWLHRAAGHALATEGE